MNDPDEPLEGLPQAPIETLTKFHRDVDRKSGALAQLHSERIQCSAGCADCCRDDLSVNGAEADLIRRFHPELLSDAAPHPEGACAFLDERKHCRIYDHRPYVCRTQGLPLRWFAPEQSLDGMNEMVVEMRDICPLNLPGPELESLDAEDCWLLGPFEDRLDGIAGGRPGAGRGERIRLRDLFERSG